MPTWEEFQNKHVLDPTVDRGYASWSVDEWNNWLRRRLPVAFGTTSRSLNSIIIATPSAIENTFKNSPRRYKFGDQYWSNEQFTIYFLRINYTNSYEVHYCRSLFFVAKLDSNSRPVHFHGQDQVKHDGQIQTGSVVKNFCQQL